MVVEMAANTQTREHTNRPAAYTPHALTAGAFVVIGVDELAKLLEDAVEVLPVFSRPWILLLPTPAPGALEPCLHL